MKRCLVMFALVILTILFAVVIENSMINEKRNLLAEEDVSSEVLQLKKEIAAND